MKKAKQKLNRLAEGDLQAIGDIMGGLLDKQAAVLASKKDLEDLVTKKDLKDEISSAEFRIKTELKDYMHQGFEAVLRGMDNLADRFVEKERFEKLVEWAKVVGEKIGVKPKI